MKKILSLLVALPLLAGCALAQTPTTQVLFPVNSMFGGISGKTITVTAVNTLFTDGYNLYAGTFTSVPSNGGTNPIVSLQPNDYLLTVAGVVRPLRFRVPASTNILNLVTSNLITSGPLFYFGTNGWVNLNVTGGLTMVTNSDGSITLAVTGFETNGTTAAALAGLSTVATDTNVTADGAGNVTAGSLTAGSLTATGTVSATTFAGAGTNLFYNQNASGALDLLYVAGFGYGQNGWVEIITNFSTGAGQLVTVPPSPVGLYTAEISGRGGVLAYFATVSNTNYVTLAGAGTAIANGVYTWNGTAYSNAVTSCWITNAGSSAAYLLHAGTNLYHSVQFFAQMQPPQSASFSPLWLNSTFSGKQFYGTSPGPVSYPIVTLDFGQNNCLVTNLQYNSMTALATNTPVPISAHLVGTNVFWTSP